ncbi:MAG: hypothetical protein WAZ18_05760 [Alphaproteobacteria bacterium]
MTYHHATSFTTCGFAELFEIVEGEVSAEHYMELFPVLADYFEVTA